MVEGLVVQMTWVVREVLREGMKKEAALPAGGQKTRITRTAVHRWEVRAEEAPVEVDLAEVGQE